MTDRTLITSLRDAGIEARPCWYDDQDEDVAVFLVEPNQRNLQLLDAWLEGRPKLALAP